MPIVGGVRVSRAAAFVALLLVLAAPAAASAASALPVDRVERKVTAVVDAALAVLSSQVSALAQPEMKAKLLAQGMISASSTPEQLGANIRVDHERLSKLVKATGIQLN